jgi:hypothetical protein
MYLISNKAFKNSHRNNVAEIVSQACNMKADKIAADNSKLLCK